MDTAVTFSLAIIVITFFVACYVSKMRLHEGKARKIAAHSTLHSEPRYGLRPYIDSSQCIGCAACTTVCPEGDVLAMLGGRAFVVNAQKCIGHERCVEACPVGALTMVMAAPKAAADTPHLTAELETTVRNLFVVGELGGLPLIRNAINQGRECIDIITDRVRSAHAADPNIYDVIIVGAGPAGISASLRAIENKLKYLTIERDEVGGTVARFPRQKVITTTPLEFPLYGKLHKTELLKEHLLALWDMVLNRAEFNVCTDSMVNDVQKSADGIFHVLTATQQHRARYVVLAIGRAGNPRKLGIKGEQLPKVMYRLIDAHQYQHKNVIVVGGGDSAVEAAIALAQQTGNRVTLSYRRQELTRVKERNAMRVRQFMRAGRLRVIFNSIPLEFRRESVVLSVAGRSFKLANDYAWIFAGGTPPNEFLKKIGVGLGASLDSAG
ncbi:MAG TPA: NAD(P)-binding domain-containing protein [Terriglobales bacterium]|nr:NAD(P)-binding domain-containing protein [Terriglobales bacterium]